MSALGCFDPLSRGNLPRPHVHVSRWVIGQMTSLRQLALCGWLRLPIGPARLDALLTSLRKKQAFFLVPFRAFITFEGNRERLGTLWDGTGASLGLGEVIGWRLHLVSNQGLDWRIRVSLGAPFLRILGRVFRLVVIGVLVRNSSTRSCYWGFGLVWV